RARRAAANRPARRGDRSRRRRRRRAGRPRHARRFAARADPDRAATACLPRPPARPGALQAPAAHPGLGLRRLRPKRRRGPRQRPAPQARSTRPAHPPHRPRPRLPPRSAMKTGSLRARVSFRASRTSIDHAVTNLLLVELLVAAAALVLATLLVLQGTRTALRPLSAVIETATRIAQGDSKLRLTPSRTDTELGSLAQAFDQMVDALETAVEDARASDAATRRFLADASHELRTPIAALQASAETLLREQPERPERDRLEAAIARDSERLGRLVNDLLGIARLEAHPTR